MTVPRARWFTIIGANDVIKQRLVRFEQRFSSLRGASASLYPNPKNISNQGTSQYLVIFERDKGGGWGAYVPDLPGLGVVGDTRREADQLIREGIAIHIAGLREDGLAIPEPTTQAELISVAA